MARSLGVLAIFVIAILYEFGPLIVGCGIKGNISYRAGEHIYHVLGQKYYFQTLINPFQGERWFCSEDAVLRPVGGSRVSS